MVSSRFELEGWGDGAGGGPVGRILSSQGERSSASWVAGRGAMRCDGRGIRGQQPAAQRWGREGRRSGTAVYLKLVIGVGRGGCGDAAATNGRQRSHWRPMSTEVQRSRVDNRMSCNIGVGASARRRHRLRQIGSTAPVGGRGAAEGPAEIEERSGISFHLRGRRGESSIAAGHDSALDPLALLLVRGVRRMQMAAGMGA
jgi:hypothetical protein